MVSHFIGGILIVANIFSGGIISIMKMPSDKEALLDLLNGRFEKSGAGKLDWDEIVKIADSSQAAGLLFNKIKGRKDELAIPDKIYDRLQKTHQITKIRNIFILEEFEKLSRLLKEASVPFIPLKGIYLLHTLYRDDIGVRSMEDVDILIRETDVEKADAVLRAIGYHPPEHDDAIIKEGLWRRPAIMYFKKSADGFRLVPVHLHWHITNISLSFFEMMGLSKIDMDEIWRGATPFDNEGSGELAMSPSHALLELCEHGLRHGFARLNLLYDIHSLVERHNASLDWQNLAGRARSWGMAVPLNAGLAITRRAFGTAIPESFSKALRPGRAPLLEKLCVGHISNDISVNENMSFFLYLAMNRRLIDKLRFLIMSINSRAAKICS